MDELAGPLRYIAFAAPDSPQTLSEDQLSRIGVHLLPWSSHEAYTFPHGSPSPGTLYVLNPVEPSTYLPASTFHPSVFEHKLCEATRLASSLGAEQITIRRRGGWRKDILPGLNETLMEVIPSISSSAPDSYERMENVVFSVVTHPIQMQHLPSNLLWYESEHHWKMLAEARIKFGLRHFTSHPATGKKDTSFHVRYTDDGGVTEDLIRGAKKAGLAIGSTFRPFTSTTWSVDVIFGQNPQELTINPGAGVGHTPY